MPSSSPWLYIPVSKWAALNYRKWEKICWAKLLWIPPNVVFIGKLSRCLTLQHLYNAIIRSLYVTGFRKTDHIVTIDIARNTDLKY